MEKIQNREKFIKESSKSLLNILDSFKDIKILDKNDFNSKDAALVNVDLINGFCKKGNLSSEKVLKIVPETVRINELFKEFKKVFLIDYHAEDSEEFKAYVTHCIKNTEEAEIIDELKKYVNDNAAVCHKNSVNGFMCPEYSKWLNENKNIINLIVIGDVTDICVMNFCLSMRTYFNEFNIPGRVIVPLSGIETFDLDVTNHNADLMNLFALYNMRMNGIEIVKDII